MYQIKGTLIKGHRSECPLTKGHRQECPWRMVSLGRSWSPGWPLRTPGTAGGHRVGGGAPPSSPGPLPQPLAGPRLVRSQTSKPNIFPFFLKGPSREILNLWRFQYIKPTQISDLLTKLFCNLHGFEIPKKFKFFLTARFLESRSRNDSNTSHFYTNSFQIPYRVPSRPRASSQGGLICGRLQQQKLKPNVLLDPLNPKNSVE